MSKSKTTIAIEKHTRNLLFQHKTTPEETYDDVIQTLLEGGQE